MNTKIFGIGLDKTGTTSLHSALKILGLKSVHYKCPEGNLKDLIKNNNDNNLKLLTSIEHYDAFSDWSHPSTHELFIKLDQQYPNSKFILTARDLDGWLTSREKHVLRIRDLNQLRKQYPNDPWYHILKDKWISEFNEHHAMVYDYFKSRQNDLLILELTNENKWEKLCGFLGYDVPPIPFPSKNKTSNKKKYTSRIFKKVRNLIQKVINRTLKSD